jgi:hypothetical protein
MRLDRGAGRPGDRQTSGETKQRMKWRRHYTHIREQGGTFRMKWRNCCIREQLISCKIEL